MTQNFYSNAQFVWIYRKLARGDLSEPNAYEQEIIAELIRKGYVSKKNQIQVTMPVFTVNARDAVLEILNPAISDAAAILAQMQKKLVDILRNHVPSHLKKGLEAVAYMRFF